MYKALCLTCARCWEWEARLMVLTKKLEVVNGRKRVEGIG